MSLIFIDFKNILDWRKAAGEFGAYSAELLFDDRSLARLKENTVNPARHLAGRPLRQLRIVPALEGLSDRTTSTHAH